MELNIAKEFTNMPGGGKKSDTPNSGEEFSERLLKPKYDEAIRRGEILNIYIDGTWGYCPSFIKESFVKLVEDGYDRKELFKNINFISENEDEIERFRECILGEKDKTKKSLFKIKSLFLKK